MLQPENLVQSCSSGSAVAVAAGLTERYKDMAISQARILLYAALNNQKPAQVEIVARACLIIMEHDRFMKKVKTEAKMSDMDRVSHLRTLAASLDELITFAEQEDDFLFAAKLDEARVHFSDRYALDEK